MAQAIIRRPFLYGGLCSIPGLSLCDSWQKRWRWVMTFLRALQYSALDIIPSVPLVWGITFLSCLYPLELLYDLAFIPLSCNLYIQEDIIKKTPWPQSASELYRQSGRRRSAMLVPTFADRGVSRGQHNGSPRPLICFLDRSRYFLFKQLLN